MSIPNILLVYTGGTIGMISDPETGILKAFDFNHLSEQIPELKRMKVNLEAISFETPIDSSEMNPIHWKKIAEIIFQNYEMYDGFVVLHGSDTMAYSASAISFMLQGIQKPVIFTGSQLPIGEIRTDGKENLLTSIEIAASKLDNGLPIIQEVGIYFEYSLYRANRTSKVSANEFEAFSSPNFPELAVAGVSIRYNQFMSFEKPNLELFTNFDNRIALLKIFPGFDPIVYKNLFDFSSVKGIVIETYGAGNAPTNESFTNLLMNYIHEGGIVLNITQCSSGKVEQGRYETSSIFQKNGVVSGYDLTTEAAVTKMMYLLGKYPDNRTEVVKLLNRNIAGEISIS